MIRECIYVRMVRRVIPTNYKLLFGRLHVITVFQTSDFRFNNDIFCYVEFKSANQQE